MCRMLIFFKNTQYIDFKNHFSQWKVRLFLIMAIVLNFFYEILCCVKNINLKPLLIFFVAYESISV